MSENPFAELNRKVIDEFRANGGQVTGAFAGAPMVIITTTGRRSGQPRTIPLVHTRDGDAVVIIASKGGDPKHPEWYLNLVADPTVEVEVGEERFTARARVAEGDERERLFRAQADLMPNFDEYQAATDRVIPVVVLERV